ncbi:bacillithiol biosynthesis deacetylase BshB1 [Roseivirga sp. BDSF3-8]|uniref:bacillithiol biosynthesis deacetylase BshB1 n=1 Tax=Roseivirga sp. BDSF3-8 TaxID=3241598 RepID=UPI003531E0FA
MKLDILVFAAHPDDAELSCSGTIAAHVAKGKKVGIVDLTRGEMGTRGSADLRDQEAAAAAKILGLAVRDNLRFQDSFFQNDRDHQMAVIKAIRKYQPEIILANAIHDRHPDHGRAAELLQQSVFLSGLRKITTTDDDKEQQPWRPKAVYNYVQSLYIKPDFVMDITGYWKVKMDSIRAYESQFFDPKSEEPETYISRPEFIDFLEARAREYGNQIGVTYGEGFTVNRTPGVSDLFVLT